MKKLIIIMAVIMAIFIALVVVTNIQQKQNVEGNPFGKDKLHTETQKQLDDPLYQNIITPDQLKENLDAGETKTIYFYSSTCPACKQTSPVVVPMAEEMGIDMELYNLQEFEQGWDDYRINSTPTFIHFVDGQEVERLENYHQDSNVYTEWFEKVKETPSE
ncbi:thioredoxin family protein [Sutcliffiella horikoshii]|uniref:Thioredoxin family protein n=1 Tax=Sutcliffiella horikoshii TaxID=79883 RepID=A0A5D4SM75_9BACI|nr:thioredoxin family protein [Sutcliffiella horikoshii]TYS64525.1 thioredoxin family protein [Sutcliffiella horikoshii]